MKEYAYTAAWNNYGLVSLEQCPFCGADPEIRRISMTSYAIRCTNHQCMAEQAVYSSLNEAVERWNHRVK